MKRRYRAAIAAIAVAVLAGTAQGSCAVALPSGETPLRIEGTGLDGETRGWAAEPRDFAANACYRVSFEHRKDAGTTGSTLCTGIKRCNFDTGLGEHWAKRSYVLLTGEGDGGNVKEPIHFGLYKVKGPVEVRNFTYARVSPVHAPFEGGNLGKGEMLVGSRYMCAVTWGGESGNYARAMKSFRGRLAFNSNRWEFSGGGEMTFRHSLAGRRFLKGGFTVRLQRYWRGSLNVEFSTDGARWIHAGTLDAEHKPLTAELPTDAFPCDSLLVRITGAKDASMQVVGYTFWAEVDGESAYAIGDTAFAAEGEDVKAPAVSGIPYYNDSYGERLPGSDGAIAFWRASSGWKVPRAGRKPPARTADAVEISAAANEAEAAQLVVSPKVALDGVRVEATPPVCRENGASLPPGAVEVLRVRYVNVTEVLEGNMIRDWYPDPLPPQKPEGVAVDAGENQPFWVRVKPPKGTRRGVYEGRLAVSGTKRGGGSFKVEVPYRVKVFGFELPDAMTCKTAFGLRGNIEKVHRAKTAAERARVTDSYFGAMAAYHMSPYYPAKRVGFWTVKWKGLDEAKAGNPEKAEPVFDWTRWDAEMERVMSRYHFTSFRLDRTLCIGVGASSSRGKVNIAGFTDDQPEYEVLIKKYLGEIDRHLKEKGWADKALVYSFDEPRPEDSAFVMKGLMRAKRYAPSLRRFLTAPVRRELVGGPDIWCPIFPDLHNDAEKERRAAGDEFWSYVCMYPRAPYATLFIEHPGVELRTWLWQCRAERIAGVLVWDCNNWSGRNPYETPMARNSEGGYYGNGDGLFLYPPETAMEGSGEGFIDEPPVGSVRGEMLRDGIEDYEYFAILQRLCGDGGAAGIRDLLEVPTEVSKSLTEFSTDPAPIERHRERLAAAIEAMLAR